MRKLHRREKGPPAVRGDDGKTGGFNRHHNRSPACQVRQPPPRDPRKVSTVPVNQPTEVICGWCRNFCPWSSIAAFFGRLKFCSSCMAEIGPEAMEERA